MRGYFARVASRLSGSPTKSALKPQRSNFWTGKQKSGPEEINSDKLAPAAQWPDAFDGNPTPEKQRPQRKQNLSQAQNPQVQPSTRITNISSQKLQPSVQKQPESKPSALTPPTQKRESISTEPAIKETLQVPNLETQNQVLPKKNPAQQEPNKNVAPTAKTENFRPQPPTRIPFSRQLRETKMEEGLLSEMPVQQLQNPKPEPHQLSPAVQENKSERIIEREIHHPPAQEKPTMIMPEAPAKQNFVSKENGQLLPQVQQRTVESTRAPQVKTPKQELVIGKITVEVVEPAQPSIVVAPVQAQKQISSPKPSSSRRGNNLKYGLGQI